MLEIFSNKKNFKKIICWVNLSRQENNINQIICFVSILVGIKEYRSSENYRSERSS